MRMLKNTLSKMRNKKGIVLPTTLKLVIAVLCILVLIYLAASLYSAFIVKSEIAQARATLENIMGKIGSLEEGETEEYLVVNPKGWYFIGYGNEVCICPYEVLRESRKECCEKGAHLNIGAGVLVDSACTFPILKNQYEGCVSLSNVPLILTLVKTRGITTIRTEASMAVSDIFDKFLEFKGDEEKTIKELCIEFIDKPSDSGLRDQIEEKVEDFFSDREDGVQFQIIGLGEERIIFQLFIDKGKKIISNLQDYRFYQNSLSKKLDVKNLEGKDYSIILKVGEWKYNPRIVR